MRRRIAPAAATGGTYGPDLTTSRATIIIDKTYTPGALTNFPVLLTQASLPGMALQANGAHPALNGGGDLRFTSSPTDTSTRLPLEVVSFVTNNDSSAATAELYVRVPAIAGSGTNDTIYVWWGRAALVQPAHGATRGSRDSVWANNYVGVMHFEDAVGNGNAVLNSTGRTQGTMAVTGMTSVTGKIGKGFRNPADASAVTMASSADWSIGVNGEVSFWYNPDENASATHGMYVVPSGADYSHGYMFNILTGTSIAVYWGGFSTALIATTVVTASAWQQYRINCAGTGANQTTFDRNASTPLYTGTATAYTPNTGTVTFMSNGYGNSGAAIYDELRISNVARSTDWRNATYNNQNSPSTFALKGPEAYVGP
jgi:hypothetical protein